MISYGRLKDNLLLQVAYALLYFYLILTIQPAEAADNDTISVVLPPSYRAEGKLMLEYRRGVQTIMHEFAFSEVVDNLGRRSKVTIGQVFYEPNVYFNRHGRILKVNDKGHCELVRAGTDDSAANGAILIPELDWFVKMTYTNKELLNYAKRQFFDSSVSVLVKMVLENTNSAASFTRIRNHRNMDCRVASVKCGRSKVSECRFEAFIPPINTLDSEETTFFSVMETTKLADDNKSGLYEVKFTLDYHTLEKINYGNLADMQKLEDEFSLPFGAGCSEMILQNRLRPIIQSESFVMVFNQFQSHSLISLAYDHDQGYLRREILAYGTVSIWDLNEGLMYSVDTHGTVSSVIDAGKYNDRAAGDEPQFSSRGCSVTRIDDESLGPAQRPLTKKPGDSPMGKRLDILEYLGAQSLAYIGRTTMRHKPYLVYETILEEPPAVFALTTDTIKRTSGNFDYIVQFHLMATTALQQDPANIGKDFWPAKINLIKRHKESKRILDSYDVLDVADFHWGLFGLPQKPSELFMVPECFNIEEEQAKVELLLEFRRNNVKFPLAEDDTLQLRTHKYQLEQQLLNSLFSKVFKISRLHLTEFDLTLRPHDAFARLIISDRDDDKQLSYFGRGEVPAEANQKKLVFSGSTLGERGCILLASHITGVTMVAYCPETAERLESQCTVIGQSSGALVRTDKPHEVSESDPFAETNTECYVYRYSAAQPPESGTKDWLRWRKSIKGHQLEMTVEDYENTPVNRGSTPRPGVQPRATYQIRVRNSNVQKEVPLLVVYNYKYTLEDGVRDEEYLEHSSSEGRTASSRQTRPPKVRSFPMMNYDTIGDCARMCNLDVACFSYSYCHAAKSSEQTAKDDGGSRCLLSSLDIRSSSIETQLLQAVSGEPVIVEDAKADGTGKYNLTLDGSCAIHEKDYLDSYSETGEIVTMPAVDAGNYLQFETASECAKMALEVEGKQDHVVSQTIAYCPSTQVCLLDSNLFHSLTERNGVKNIDEEPAMDNEVPTGDEAGSDELESSCIVYRRKYQTFFHVSTGVFKRANGDNDQQVRQKIEGLFNQVALKMGTVEECAHACWMQLGSVCASFDYCTGGSLCLINTIAIDEPLVEETVRSKGKKAEQIEHSKLEELLEQRAGCLHYERDLRVDQIRRTLALSKHNILDLELAATKLNGARQKSTGGFILKGVLFCLVSAAFFVGLLLGSRLNERFERGGFGSSILSPAQSIGDLAPDHGPVTSTNYDNAIPLGEIKRNS